MSIDAIYDELKYRIVRYPDKIEYFNSPGKSTMDQTIIVTMALEPEDAMLLRLNRATCPPAPEIWKTH